ncbi:unnamed protein product [Cochlearia groenlandica]
MTEFPSTTERTVASSLLLLSYGPVLFSHTRSRSVEDSSCVKKLCNEGSLMLGSNTGSRSCGSDLSSDGSFANRNDLGFKFDFNGGDPFRLVDFKTARKRRSQVTWGSMSYNKAENSMMNHVYDLSTCSVDSKEESSCLSTGSNDVSSIESKIKNQRSKEKLRVVEEEAKSKRKKKESSSSRSSSIRRRAKDILEFLSLASSSEVQIRLILGDSPDTSKALRMLLKMEEVKRYGTGGRLDPYIYKVMFFFVNTLSKLFDS